MYSSPAKAGLFIFKKMTDLVAIQGIESSYHHQAAQAYFGLDIPILECSSFRAVADAVLNHKAKYGVMAIENTIAGAIIPNYDLIDKNNLHIIGEHYIDIRHQLMALPGQSIEALTEVHSHQMALLQCADFFTQYPHIKLVEDKDTASTALDIKNKQLKGIGAIASVSSAKLFGLEILASDIQTMENNATRFFILSKNEPKELTDFNKVSLKFQLPNKKGSLATVLNVISHCDLNMTKIQSLPVLHEPWKYAFFIDLEFDNQENFQKMYHLLDIMAENIKILGKYTHQII